MEASYCQASHLNWCLSQKLQSLGKLDWSILGNIASPIPVLKYFRGLLPTCGGYSSTLLAVSLVTPHVEWTPPQPPTQAHPRKPHTAAPTSIEGNLLGRCHSRCCLFQSLLESFAMWKFQWNTMRWEKQKNIHQRISGDKIPTTILTSGFFTAGTSASQKSCLTVASPLSAHKKSNCSTTFEQVSPTIGQLSWDMVSRWYSL